YARIIGLLRPRYVVVENVAALVRRGLDRVLGDLSAIGYDAEWATLPAAAFGAPHLRRRVLLVAYPGGLGREANSLEARVLDPGLLEEESRRPSVWVVHPRRDARGRVWPIPESGIHGVADGFPSR